MDLHIRSAFATEPHHSASAKYQFIPTIEILNTLEREGWHPVKATEARVMKESDKDGFQKHMIRLRQQSAQSIVLRETVFPEIILVNSHSTASSFWFMLGLFRLACLNGMVVCDADLGEVRVRHVGYEAAHALDAVHQLIGRVPAVQQTVNRWNEIEMTKDQMGVYAEAAAMLRWEDTNKVDLQQLIYPTRDEDRAPTLWNAFQRVQEKMINGGRYMRSARTMRRNRAVGITGIDSNVRLNKALWLLTEKMAGMVAA